MIRWMIVIGRNHSFEKKNIASYTSILGMPQAGVDQEVIAVKHLLERDPIGWTLIKGGIIDGILR